MLKDIKLTLDKYLKTNNVDKIKESEILKLVSP